MCRGFFFFFFFFFFLNPAAIKLSVEISTSESDFDVQKTAISWLEGL